MQYKYLLNMAPFPVRQKKMYSFVRLHGIPHGRVILKNPQMKSSSLGLVHSSCQSYIQWINVNWDRI